MRLILGEPAAFDGLFDLSDHKVEFFFALGVLVSADDQLDAADVLVHEAMRFEPIEALPPRRRFILDYHADTRLLGALATRANVGTLVLTHLLPVPETAADKEAFAGDIRTGGFSGDLIVADDLDAVTIAASRRSGDRAP